MYDEEREEEVYLNFDFNMASMVDNPEVELEDARRSRLELKNLQRKFEECFMEG